MTDRTIIITGASDGIGAAAARQLASEGERVVLVGRSRVKTEALASELGAPWHVADFAQLGDVRRMAGELTEEYPRIDVLANNAGAVMGSRSTTVDGYELTFQVNHLAPFLLTMLLMPTLVASKAALIQTSSIAAERYGLVDIDDLQNAHGYSPNKAYGGSKLMNILFTSELHRRYHEAGITAAAFHPGNVATSFASDTTSWFRFIYGTPLRHVFLINADKGAETMLWLIRGAADHAWKSGEYYDKCRRASTNLQAYDEQLAAALWQQSEAMVAE